MKFMCNTTDAAGEGDRSTRRDRFELSVGLASVRRFIRDVLAIALVILLGLSPAMGEAGDKNPDLILSIKEGRIDHLTSHLNSGGDANARDRDGKPALTKAILWGGPATRRRLKPWGKKFAPKLGDGTRALPRPDTASALDMVRLLLDKGASPNARDGDGRTALAVAADQGDLEVVKLLLDRGAEVNARDYEGTTPLMIAALRGDPNMVELLLDKGADLHAMTKNGRNALAEAAAHYRLDIVRLLKARGAKLTLPMAAALGDADEVHRLINQGADPNARDGKGETALMRAAQWIGPTNLRPLKHWGKDFGRPKKDDPESARIPVSNRLKVARLFLENGADVDAKDRSGRTALMTAAESGVLDLAKLLLNKGADVNARSNRNITSLMIAARCRNLDMVELLLQHGAYIDAQAMGGGTPLTEAVEQGALDVAKLLLARGADVNAQGYGGTTALMVAARRGHLDMFALLLDNGADLHATTKDGRTALTEAGTTDRFQIHQILKHRGQALTLPIAALFGDVAEVRHLLTNGADPNARDSKGENALMEAVRRTGPARTKPLTSWGRDSARQDKDGVESARIPVSDGLAVAKMLLESGAEVNAKKKSGKTALMMAVDQGALDMAKLLLDKAADPNVQANDGRTPLMSAASHGRADMIELLLQHRGDINVQGKDGRTAVTEAMAKNRFDVVKLLRDRGARLTLATAAVLGDVGEVQRLTKQGADLNAKDKDGQTPLMKAAGKGRMEIVDSLLEQGADVNSLDQRGRTALSIVHRERPKGYEKIAHILKAHGGQFPEGLRMADFKDKVLRRGDALYFRLKDGTVVPRKSTPPEDIEGFTDSTGSTRVYYLFDDFIDPWFVITEGYYEGSGVELINRDTGKVVNVYGRSMFSPDKTRFLAIGYPSEGPDDTEIWRLSREGAVREWVLEGGACHEFRWSNQSTVEALGSRGENRPVLAQIVHDGNSWRCEGSPEICREARDARELERSPADRTKAHSGYTPLMEAAEKGDVQAVTRLLDNDSYINATDQDRMTALDWAAKKGHLEVVKLLVHRGAAVIALEPRDASPLVSASGGRRWDVVKFFMDNGAHANPEFTRNVLAKAAQDGHVELVSTLLDRGVAVNPTCEPYALMEAAGEGRLDAVRMLLNRGADVNAQDRFGRTALMSAAVRGHAEIVALLLQREADVRAADKDGNTALADAVWGGFSQAVQLLLQNGADINVKDTDGLTALQLAQKIGRRELAELLKAHGAKE